MYQVALKQNTDRLKMLSTVIIILTSLIAPSYQFSIEKFSHGRSFSRTIMTATSTAIYPSKDTDVLTIKVATVDEFPRCAGFLSSNMYASDIPKGDQSQLARRHLLKITLSGIILFSTKQQSS
jgi:hypothetical protein